ncbi:MAG: hypothetical protein AB7I50_03490 [Vicinamibacterales bacterium]
MPRLRASSRSVLLLLVLAAGADRATWARQRVTAERAPEPASFFFEMSGYSETWLNLTPPPDTGDTLSPLSLNITLRYRGRPAEGSITTPLLAIVIRAQANPQYRPNVVRQPAFMIYADREQVWDASLRVDFTPSGSPCEGCALSTDVVQVVVPIDSLARLAQAQEVTGAAFGFTFSLNSAQRAAIAALAERVPAGQRP